MKILYSRLTDIGLVYSAAIWGSTFFIVKAIINKIDPVTLVGYRFTLAGIILGLILILNKKSIFKDYKKGFILGFLLWLIYIPQTIGLIYTTASNSGFITGLFVAFLPILSWIFLKELPSGRKLIAVLISMIGLWLLTGGIEGINFGDMLTLITAIACASHIFVVDIYVKRDTDPYILCFQQFLFVGLLSLVVGIIFNNKFVYHDVNTLWTVIFLALLPTLSAFLIQLVAQKYTTPLKTSFIFSLEPLFAALFAWTLGGEIFIPIRACGGFLIFLAIILYELPLEKFILRKNVR